MSKPLGTRWNYIHVQKVVIALARPEVEGTHAYSDHMHVSTLTTVLLPAGPITTSDKSDHRLRYGNYIARLATTCRTKVELLNLNRWLRFSDQRPSLVGGRHFNRREPHLAVITNLIVSMVKVSRCWPWRGPLETKHTPLPWAKVIIANKHSNSPSAIKL